MFPCLAFYMGSRLANSGLQAHTITLLTKSFFIPQNFIFSLLLVEKLNSYLTTSQFLSKTSINFEHLLLKETICWSYAVIPYIPWVWDMRLYGMLFKGHSRCQHLYSFYPISSQYDTLWMWLHSWLKRKSAEWTHFETRKANLRGQKFRFIDLFLWDASPSYGSYPSSSAREGPLLVGQLHLWHGLMAPSNNSSLFFLCSRDLVNRTLSSEILMERPSYLLG